MKITFTLIFIFVNLMVYGQTITTDRPTQTTGPTTVSKGAFQLETGALYSNEGGNGNYLQLPGNLFRIGLFKGFELRLVNGLVFRSKYTNKISASFSQFEFGFKLQLLNKEDGKTQIGFVAHGGTSSNAENWEYFNDKSISVLLAINHQLNATNSLSYNVGYRVTEVEMPGFKNQTQNIFCTLNYGHSLTDRLGIFLEAYGGVTDQSYFVAKELDAFDLNMDAGFTWLVRDNLQLDYSFGYGIFHRLNFHSIGISFNIAPKKN